MFSILNRALSWAITSFKNKLCLRKRSRLIKALDNRFYVKFIQLEIDLFCKCCDTVLLVPLKPSASLVEFQCMLNFTTKVILAITKGAVTSVKVNR